MKRHFRLIKKYLFFLVVISCIGYGLVDSPSGTVAASSYSHDLILEGLLRETNDMRDEAKAPILEVNEKLTKAAQAKLEDMFEGQYWSHNSPSGKTPWSFVQDSDYAYVSVGENLAKNYYESSSIVEAWMESPSHREAMLDKGFSHVGFASASGILNGERVHLTVAIYGQPQSLPAVLGAVTRVENRSLVVVLSVGMVSAIWLMVRPKLKSAYRPQLG